MSTEKQHYFNNSANLGKLGQLVVQRWLESQEKTIAYYDVSDDKYYWDKDIDGIVILKNGENPPLVRAIEIKTDKYTSRNIYYEVISSENPIKNQVKWGCMIISEAAYLFYYFVSFGQLYIIDFAKYRQWFKKNKERMTGLDKNVVNGNSFGSTYVSKGYAFPRSWLWDEKWVKIISNLYPTEKELKECNLECLQLKK